MSETLEQRTAKRLRAEYEAFENNLQAQGQAMIDRIWQDKLDFEAEVNDTYMVGGFQEFHSKTPSFHKSKRDRDWR